MRAAALALLFAAAACQQPADGTDARGILGGRENKAAPAEAANASAMPVEATVNAPGRPTGGVDGASPPNPETAQRRAILDALRPAIEARIEPPIQFVIDRIGVENGYALVIATPQRPGGAAIDGANYFPNWTDMDGLTVSAVLRFQNGRWNLVNHQIGATDVWYCGTGTGAPDSLTGCSS